MGFGGPDCHRERLEEEKPSGRKAQFKQRHREEKTEDISRKVSRAKVS